MNFDNEIIPMGYYSGGSVRFGMNPRSELSRTFCPRRLRHYTLVVQSMSRDRSFRDNSFVY